MKPVYHFIQILFCTILFSYSTHAENCANHYPYGPSPCPCNCPKKTPLPCPPGPNPFEPFTGNSHREILDLEVWGGVGEIPLKWMRYGNSRYGTYRRPFGEAHNWNHAFHYAMFDDGVDHHGSPRLKIHFPQGDEVVFTQSHNNPNIWLPLPVIPYRLFQNGNSFILQLPNGHRYRFEKMIGQNQNVSYFLRDIHDSNENVYTLTYNSNDLLNRVTEPAGRYLEISYGVTDGVIVITEVTTQDLRKVKYNYDVYDDGIRKWVRLISVSYGDGTSAQYKYWQWQPGKLPNLEHAIDPRYTENAVNMKYTYNPHIADGYLREERNGISGEVMVTLTAMDYVRLVCYPNGRVEKYVTNEGALSNITSYTDGLGRKFTYVYDEDGPGLLEGETDPLGRKTTYVRSMYNNLLEITYPDGSQEKWERDDLDLVLKYTDELNRVTSYARDNLHRVRRIDFPDGTYEDFSYNEFGQILTHTLRNGGKEINVYDNTGLKTSFQDALTNKTSYTYNSSDLLASITDAHGSTIGYEYYERGLLKEEINADRSSKSYGYDDFGNLTSITNELRYTWRMVFDEFERLVSTTDPLNRITKYSYELLGGTCGCSHENNTPSKVTSAAGRVTLITYDIEWQKTSETVGAGTTDAATTFFEYDAAGNLVTIVDPLKRTWVYSYDLRDRRVASTEPLANSRRSVLDLVGNVVKEIRPDDGVTTNVFDPMNRLTESMDPKGQVTKMKYDREGNMVQLTDARNENYDFAYDLLNRRTKMIYPDGTFEEYKYDRVGNLSSNTNRSGDRRTYTYDNRNREIRSDWSDTNTPDIDRTYDLASRVITLISSVSALSYTYSNADEMTAETQDITGGPGPKTISYTYNDDGLRKEMTYPGGNVVTYAYTSRNQIKTITSDDSALVRYRYDLNGNRINKSLINGTSTSNAYDAANRHLTTDNQKGPISFARFDYGYDKLNRRTFVKRDGGKGDVYNYDATDQVTGVRYEANNPEGSSVDPIRTVDYNWDGMGNRMSLIDNGSTTAYNTNKLNQYTNVGGDALTYNANGALQSFGGWKYSYDAQDRLIRAEKGSTTVEFAYDARNRRVKHAVNTKLTFLYYASWNLIEERSSNDILLTKYIHAQKLDELLTKTSLNQTVYYHHDAPGSVIRLTDSLGNVIEQYSYDIFGKPTIKNFFGDSIATSAFSNRFMFTGREFIQEIGLHDYRNRFYSSELGRFLQSDPLRFEADDINLYRYVGNNPSNYVDPLGLCKPGDCEPGNIQWISIEATHDVKSSKAGRRRLSIPGGVVFYVVIRYKCCVCKKGKYAWSEERTYEEALLNLDQLEVFDVSSIPKGDIKKTQEYKYALKMALDAVKKDCGP